MSIRRTTPSLLLSTLLCTASLFAGFTGIAHAEPASEAPAWAENFQNADKVKLTDNHVERFIAAAKELRAQKFDYQNSENQDWNEAFRENAQLNGVLKRHGFDDGAAFEATVYSIVAAIGSMEMEKNRPEIEQAKAQLEQMKDQMPAETYAMLEQQMLGMAQVFDDQPAGNVEVVRKYRDQLEGLDPEE